MTYIPCAVVKRDELRMVLNAMNEACILLDDIDDSQSTVALLRDAEKNLQKYFYNDYFDKYILPNNIKYQENL